MSKPDVGLPFFSFADQLVCSIAPWNLFSLKLIQKLDPENKTYRKLPFETMVLDTNWQFEKYVDLYPGVDYTNILFPRVWSNLFHFVFLKTVLNQT